MKIRVTNINGSYHARLFSDEAKLLDEMSCECKQDLGYICREMLRWQSKMGSTDPWATSARKRHNEDPAPVGKVKYLGKEINNV